MLVSLNNVLESSRNVYENENKTRNLRTVKKKKRKEGNKTSDLLSHFARRDY